MKGDWAWRILPGGACVAMRVVGDGPNAFRKELRVSRREPLASDEAVRKWLKECRVFRGHLGCAVGWHTTTLGERDVQVTAVPLVGDPTSWTMLEDAPLGRTKVAAALICARCGRVAEPGSEKYKEVLCNSCALEAGQREVRQRVEQATLPLD